MQCLPSLSWEVIPVEEVDKERAAHLDLNDAIASFKKQRENEIKQKLGYIVRVGASFMVAGAVVYALGIGISILINTPIASPGFMAMQSISILSVVLGVFILSSADYSYYCFNEIFEKFVTFRVFVTMFAFIAGVGFALIKPSMGFLWIIWSIIFYNQPSIEGKQILGLKFQLTRARLLSIAFIHCTLVIACWGLYRAFIVMEEGQTTEETIVGFEWHYAYLQSPKLQTTWLIVGIVLLAFEITVGYWMEMQARLFTKTGGHEGFGDTKSCVVSAYCLLVIITIMNTILAVGVAITDPTDGEVSTLMTGVFRISVLFSAALSLAYLIGRDRMFRFLVQQFDRNIDRQERDGAFMAQLMTTVSIKRGMTYWIHRDKNDQEREQVHDTKSVAYNWKQGIVKAVGSDEIEIEMKKLHVEEDKVEYITEETTPLIEHIKLNHHNEESVQEFLTEAREKLRCIEWKVLKANPWLFDESVRDESANDKVNLFTLSRPVNKGEQISYFISHSWHDDGKPKLKALEEVAESFQKTHNVEATFWFDKVCIDQLSITDGLKSLPLNITACSSMLCLMGDTYVHRLWCIWELFSLASFSFGEDGLFSKVKAVSLSEEDSNRSLVIEKLRNFKLDESHCYDPNEEMKLREVINAVGAERFEKRVRGLASSINFTKSQSRKDNSVKSYKLY